MKGIIALDIDGTITAEHHATPLPVVVFLKQLVQEGWRLVFITGRTFQWGFKALREMHFPYFFAVNNGALMLEMPARKIVRRKYLSSSKWGQIASICKEEGTDFVIYGGYESGDVCYYRPHQFSPELQTYLKRRTEALEENWVAVDSFDAVPLSEFAAAKCIERLNAAHRISTALESRLGLHAPVVKDPFDSSYYVVQATHPHVSKGDAVEDCKEMNGRKGVVIAAGDDNNDRSMLAHAQIRVVMATAPEDMRAAATIIAPPASELGIIQGLKEAIQYYDDHRV